MGDVKERDGVKAAGPESVPPRSTAAAPLLFSDPLLTSHDEIGNAALMRLLNARALHPGIGVSEPDDPHEREAQRGAETLASPAVTSSVRGRSPIARRPVETPGHGAHDLDAERVLRSLGAGRPLDDSLRAVFEPQLGRDLGDVRIHTSPAAAEAASALVAKAFTIGTNVAFGAGRWAPDTDEGWQLLAHELVHVAQRYSGIHRQKDDPPPLTVVTDVRLMGPLDVPASTPPVVRLDKTQEADALKQAIDDQSSQTTSRFWTGTWFIEVRVDPRPQRVLKVLARNAHPEHMYALRVAYEEGTHRSMVDDVLSLSSDKDWLARVRVYLGQQLSLHRLIMKGDKDATFRDLQRVTDRRALELFMGVPGAPVIMTSPATTGPVATKHEEPAYTTLALVQEQLRKLGPDDYYKAMRLLLEKADRARATQPPPAVPGTVDLGGFTVLPNDLAVDLASPNLSIVSIALGAPADPLEAARVELAEGRIREADTTGDWISDSTADNKAYLALADLNHAERKALALRLREKPLSRNPLGGLGLVELAEQADDAAVIKQVIQNAHGGAVLVNQVEKGIGLDVAIERAGALVQRARDARDSLPEDAPKEERTKAQAEVDRLERMFFRDTGESFYIRSALQAAAGHDEDAYAEKLRAIGADPVTVGRELVTNVSDSEGLIRVLRKIAPQHRVAAMQGAGKYDTWRTGISTTHRELIDALLQQGEMMEVDVAALEPGSPLASGAWTLDASTLNVSTLNLSTLHLTVPPSPAATIALHDLLEAMARGPGAASEVLGILVRLSEADRTSIFNDPRYRAAYNKLPFGDDKSPERDFKQALERAEKDKYGPAAAIANYPGGPGGDQRVVFEAIRLTAEREGRARLRRAYVLRERIKADPSLEDRLPLEDKFALGTLRALQATIDPAPGKDFGIPQAADREMAWQIALGEPQLTDTPDAPVDPNMEAAFMYTRLRQAAELPAGKTLTDWEGGGGPSAPVIEVLTEFDVLYDRARPGGISRADLAQLAELYYRALKLVDDYKIARAKNEMTALLVAQIVGTVVACVVAIVATGGGATPLVAGLLAGVVGGAATAAVGAKIRWKSTSYTVLRDFGTGFVEGVASVAGSALAAKIVRGATTGMAAGRAAVKAGGQAASRATSRAGAVVAEGLIDGAIGGAAGEVFQTATDEATWDRGIAQAFASMLAALARGAAMGGAAGGLVGGAIAGLGKLATRVGDDAALGVGRMLESSGVGVKVLDDLPDAAQDELVGAYRLLDAGALDEAEAVIRSIRGISRRERGLLLELARGRWALEAGGFGRVEFEDTGRWVDFVSDKEFKALAAGRRGDAVVVIKDGQPRIVARRTARPTAIREEVTHLLQWQTDPMMRARMSRLSEEAFAPASWNALKASEKLGLHLDKLEVEADAQRKLIDQFGHLADEDPDAAMRVMDARETLFNLGRRIETLTASKGKWIDVKALKIDEPPRLFARGAQTGARSPLATRGPRSIQDLIKHNKPVKGNEALLESVGYRLHRHARTGEVFRITRDPDKALPHLTVKGGKIEKGVPLATFDERKADAALEWARLSQDRTTPGWRFRDLLKKEVHKGMVNPNAGLDEGSAGLLAKWGPVLEDLEGRFPGRVKMSDFLASVRSRSLVESEVDAFRRLIRTRTVDELMKISDPTQRTAKLYELIATQPDPASMGHLFTAYRQRLMEPLSGFTVAGKKPEPFLGIGKALDKPRTPDDVLEITSAAYKRLPKGRFAIEDKSGRGAFDLDQARDYARSRDAKLAVFKQTPKSAESFDGVVYVFSRGSEAAKAVWQMKNDKIVGKLIGEPKGGIHVMYLDADGELKMLTELVTKSSK